jgi:hypothetical protein
MARGNQRDKAREKNLAKQAGEKSKNTMSGSEMMRNKDDVAAIMRAKQEKGESKTSNPSVLPNCSLMLYRRCFPFEILSCLRFGGSF